MPHQKIDSIQIYYETHGSPDNPPLLLVHGLGSSTQDWEQQVPYFETDYYVILLDIRGHGQSDKPVSPYGVDVFAKDIIALLDSLSIEKAHLAGISMGGMIAFQVAIDYPQRLLSVTIANATATLLPHTLQERVGIWMRFVIVRLLGMRKMGEVLAKRLFIYPDQIELQQQFVERWAKNDRQAYLRVMKSLVGWDVHEQITNMQIPTLLIASDEDYTPLIDKETIVARIPNAQLVVIEDARHAVTIERPEKFNTALGKFLATL